MSGAGELGGLADLDEQGHAPVEVTEQFSGRIFDVRTDRVVVEQGGEPVARDYVAHPGAVAILALRGEADAEEILVLRQYRHAVRARLIELPAGLLDVDGENPAAAAARELAEEADLAAEDWRVLVDLMLSPGASTECLRVYLARGLRDVPDAQRHARTEEEAGMVTAWVPLDDAVAAALAGRVHNAALVAGVLAAAAARSRGWDTLREADAPWELRRGRG